VQLVQILLHLQMVFGLETYNKIHTHKKNHPFRVHPKV
jgi:hypothetical protein